MRRPLKLLLLLATLALALSLTTCSLDITAGGGSTKKYLIVDHATGRLLSSYELEPGVKRAVRVVSYGSSGAIQKTFDLTYDAAGRLTRNILTTNVPAGAPIKDETTYTYTDVRDAAGRLVRTDQSSSKGETAQVYYGYDASGEARGVVQKKGDSLVMKDYP